MTSAPRPAKTTAKGASLKYELALWVVPMASPRNESPADTWRLPLAYKDMNSTDQSAAMRAAILRFLDSAGKATATEIIAAIGAQTGQEATVRRHLKYLASTQQVYYEPIGRDPIYYRNGRLAHPTLQANVRAGPRREYVIRTYNDALTGKTVTITEFAISPLGEQQAKSGVRIDLADLDAILEELTRIREKAKESNLLDGGLVR